MGDSASSGTPNLQSDDMGTHCYNTCSQAYLGDAFTTAGKTNAATKNELLMYNHIVVRNLCEAVEKYRMTLPWGRRGPLILACNLAQRRGPLPWDAQLIQFLAEVMRGPRALV